MRKLLASALIGSSLAVAPMYALADTQPIKVYYHGQEVKFHSPPFIQNGRTLVEFRPIFESLGYTVYWDGNTGIVRGVLGDHTISLRIGSNIAYADGQQYTLNVSPQIINGRTFVPLRFIGEASGESVTWDASTRTISIEDQVSSGDPTDLMPKVPGATTGLDPNSLNPSGVSNVIRNNPVTSSEQVVKDDNGFGYQVTFSDGLQMIMYQAKYLERYTAFDVIIKNVGKKTITVTESSTTAFIRSPYKEFPLADLDVSTLRETNPGLVANEFQGGFSLDPGKSIKAFFAFDTHQILDGVKYSDGVHSTVFINPDTRIIDSGWMFPEK